MKSYWRQPYQFFNEVASAIKARTMLEPIWFRTTSKYPPPHQGLHMRVELREIEFLEDKYRHLYLKQFPLERQYISFQSKTQKYSSTPMDKFFARFNELISQGVTPDSAYEKCLEEKVNSVELENLELHYFKQQAGMIYGDPKEDEILSKEPYMSPYFKARSQIDRKDYMNLVQFVQDRKDSGNTRRIHRKELNFVTNDDIIRYIYAHPEDAYFFEGMKLIPSSSNFKDIVKYFGAHRRAKYHNEGKTQELKTIEQGTDSEEMTNEDNLMTTTSENVDKAKETENKEELEKDEEEISETDSIEDHIGSIRGLIEDITQEYGIDLTTSTLYDSLDHTTRIKVLNEYLIHLPEEISLRKPFYKEQPIDEYELLSEKTLDVDKTKKSITSQKIERLFENFRKSK